VIDDETPNRRAADHRIDRIELSLEKIAEKLEQVAVLIAQGQRHDVRLDALEAKVTQLQLKDVEQGKALAAGERFLWIVIAAVMASGGELLSWLKSLAGSSD